MSRVRQQHRRSAVSVNACLLAAALAASNAGPSLAQTDPNSLPAVEVQPPAVRPARTVAARPTRPSGQPVRRTRLAPNSVAARPAPPPPRIARRAFGRRSATPRHGLPPRFAATLPRRRELRLRSRDRPDHAQQLYSDLPRPAADRRSFRRNVPEHLSGFSKIFLIGFDANHIDFKHTNNSPYAGVTNVQPVGFDPGLSPEYVAHPPGLQEVVAMDPVERHLIAPPGVVAGLHQSSTCSPVSRWRPAKSRSGSAPR